MDLPHSMHKSLLSSSIGDGNAECSEDHALLEFFGPRKSSLFRDSTAGGVLFVMTVRRLQVYLFFSFLDSDRSPSTLFVSGPSFFLR